MTGYLRSSSTDFRFGFKIDFVRNTEDPARVFRALSHLIKFSESLDKSLVRALNIEAEPVLLLDSVEEGSITNWLKNTFKFPEKHEISPAIVNELSDYLNRARGVFISFLSERETITDLSEVSQLQAKLLKLAENSKLSKFTIYGPVSHKELLDNSGKYQLGLRELAKKDKVYYLTNNIKSILDTKFNLPENSIDNILLSRTISSEQKMILKIKKPDYLGDSKWIFRHGNRTIEAKITDLNWMRSFRARKVSLIPGDSLKVIAEIVTNYDFNGEVLSEKSTIKKVIEVIPDFYKQLPLFPE